MSSPSTSAMDQFFLKLGTLFTMTKDALLEDFLGDLPSYLPDKDIDPKPARTFAELKERVGEAEVSFSKFIGYVFERLGYDLSNFEKNEELYELVSSVLSTADSIGSAVQQLGSEGINWDNVKIEPGEKDGEAKLTFDGLFSLEEGNNHEFTYKKGGFEMGVSFGDGLIGGRIKPLIDLIVDLAKLIKKFRDFEWDSLRKEYADFGDFLDDNYFTEQFAERIFDHILTVLLRNARKVFNDELREIARDIDKVKELVEEAKQEVKNEVYARIKEIRKQLDEIEKQLKEAASEAKNLLEAQYELLKEELEKIMQEILGPFGKVGEILEKIYRVLDFLGLIRTQTIEVAKYIKDYQIPTTSDDEKLMAEVDKKLAAAYAENKNNFVADANAALKAATAEIRSACPTVQIYVLRWSKVAEMFTEPASYLKEQFPIHTYDDAAALLGKVYSLVQAFNPDILDFSSIGTILNELIVRMRKELESAASEITAAVKEKIRQFIQFLIDVKKVLESYAIAIRDELKKDFYNFVNGGESLIRDLQDSLKKQADTLLSEARKVAKEGKSALLDGTDVIYQSFLAAGVPKGMMDLLEQVFVDPLVKVVREKAKEHDIFKEVDPDLWEKSLQGELEKAQSAAGKINLIGDYKTIVQDIETQVTEVFSEQYWTNGFKNLVDALETEFNRQTAKIPGNLDQLKSFGVDQVNNLLAGKSLTNPFTDFDFMAYFKIFSDQIKNFIPSDIDGYYLRFKVATEKAMGQMLGAAEGATCEAGTQAKNIAKGVENYAGKVKSFADDVFTAYWAELKKAVYDVIIRPFLSMIEKEVKRWLREELLPQVIEAARKAFMQYYKDAKALYDEFKDAIDEAAQAAQEVAKEAQKLYEKAEEKSREVAKLVEDVLLLSEDARSIETWQDGLQFAIAVYRAIPPSVKDAVKDVIGLPSWDFSGIKLPEYQLDMKDKFLAVTVYKYEKNFSFDLVAFVGQRKDKDSDGKEQVRSGVYFLPVIHAGYDHSFKLGESHELDIAASADLNKGFEKKENVTKYSEQLDKGTIGFFFTEPTGLDLPGVELLASEKAVKLYLELLFKRQKDNTLFIYGYEDGKPDNGLVHIKMDDYPQKVYAGYDSDKGGFDVGWLGKVQGLNFNISLGAMNAFFEKILKGDIDVTLKELSLGYGLQDGLTFDGDYKIKIPLKPTFDFKAVKLDNLSLELGSAGNGFSFGGLGLSLNLNFSADLEVLAFTFPDLGFGFDINFMTPDFHFGDFDFTPTIKLPDGLGLAIDIADVVKGAGIVKWDFPKGEFLGAFNLDFIDLFEAGALFLLNTKMPDGSKGFSFAGAVSVFFKSGIQLGMGFSLTGIGASLGLNRRIDVDKMRDAVYDGSLESVLFVKDLRMDNLSTILANMTAFYPVAKEHFFFGAMVQITWAEILDFTLGVFIQTPDLVIVIAGGVHLNIADAVSSLISLNANFMASFDVHKGISFDASLYDTKFVGIDFYGDIALRIYWGGSTKGFILSAGGFHPQYTPEPGFNVPKMRRLGYGLHCGPIDISNESYFAVTSNTVQFGSDSRLKIGWDKYGLHGYMYFNVLFQFNPFAFMFDAGCGVKVVLFGETLLSIDLYLEVSGPAPWHIAGKAKFTIIFTFHVEFSETWGKSQEVSEEQYIELLPIMAEAFENDNNWTVIRNDLIDGLVSVYLPEEDVFAMSPSDTVAFSQEMLPLDEDYEKYGEATPHDARRIEIEKIWFEGDQEATYVDTTTSFAPTMIQKMSEKEKLAAPSYVEMNAGFELTAGADTLNGDGTLMDSTEIDLDVQGGIDWSKWQSAATENEQTKAKESASEIVVKKKVSAERKLALKKMALPQIEYRIGRRIKTKQAGSTVVDERDTVVMRPSSRRDAAGFERYVAQLDDMMNRDVRDYITALDSGNVKESLAVMKEQDLKTFVVKKQKIQRKQAADLKKEALALRLEALAKKQLVK